MDVCRIRAARGPHRFTCHPVMNRFQVPKTISVLLLFQMGNVNKIYVEVVPQNVVLMPRILNWVAVPAAISLRLHRSPSPS